MIDARRILADLQKQAEATFRELKVDERLADARVTVDTVGERLRDDPNARVLTAGAGGVLLAGLLGSRGGRRIVGDIARTGAVAAIGALAYRAWIERQGGFTKVHEADELIEAQAAGFPIDPASDPEFAVAVVRVMAAAAHADGTVSKAECDLLLNAAKKSALDPEERDFLASPTPETETFRLAKAAAKSPNHAAELYAAAVVMTAEPSERESSFLARLADALGVEPGQAGAIRRASLE